MKKQLLFLTLHSFSATGGIEKVNRILGKVMFDFARSRGLAFAMISLHDTAAPVDERYFPNANFEYCAGSKFTFFRKVLSHARRDTLLVLSHVHILPVGVLAKKAGKNNALLLLCHGIEIWKMFSPSKKQMLQAVDLSIAVSKHTADIMLQNGTVKADRLKIINNALDPFLAPKVTGERNNKIPETLNIPDSSRILFSLTRLHTTERHKGYEDVIKSLKPAGEQLDQDIHYIIAGKYTEVEKEFITALATEHAVAGQVHLAGFIADEMIPEYFAIADAYILPSKKEGFGISFIEAMYHGLPVIAGNADGSVDALAGGQLGLMVTPGDTQAVTRAISEVIKNKEKYIPSPEMIEQYFGYEQYHDKWSDLLLSYTTAAKTTAA